MKIFSKKSSISNIFWIPQSDWEQICSRLNVKIKASPHEIFIGLAYNKEKQLVQVTKNALSSSLIFYVTLLEEQSLPSIILNEQSSMSVKQVRKRIKDSSNSAEFELLDLHVRKEGIGERGLLLESLIYDLQNRYEDFVIRGSFNHISHSGKISLECFTRYGFTLNGDQLIYTKK